MQYPKKIGHWIRDREVAGNGHAFPKVNPATGEAIVQVLHGTAVDVSRAVASATEAFSRWSRAPVLARAELVRKAVLLLASRKEELAEIVALESGKSKQSARAEVGAAIECGFFFAGEGRRFVGEVIPSANPNRRVLLTRVPVGVGALIAPFNNPAAGVAWKLFPALLSGNAVIIKSHEDTPFVALWYAKLLKDAGFPSGVISVLQGTGTEVGVPLVQHPGVQFVSFTGSVGAGRAILKATAERFAKVSIESGGKNPFVVLEDADLERAATLAVAGAFVDAGQRCAATSRIIVLEAVYEKFKKLFLKKVAALKVGAADTDDYGAIVNEKRMRAILSAVRAAEKRRVKVVTGGARLTDPAHARGYFIAPTVLENAKPDDPVSQEELFGPVVALYRASDFDRAIQLANNSRFGLASAIHTKDRARARAFEEQCRAGVVRINGPTHGSEPHMPFGGFGLSGNGWREPGVQALDFYSNWKQVSEDV